MLLTKSSFYALQNKIELLKDELKTVRIRKSEAANEGPGDGYHDNFAFEQATLQEEMLSKRIYELQHIMHGAQIIEFEGAPDGAVKVGSLVKFERIDKSGNAKKFEVKIVDIQSGEHPHEATLNSPIGRALLYKQKGDFGEFSLGNGEEFEFEVLSVIN